MTSQMSGVPASRPSDRSPFVPMDAALAVLIVFTVAFAAISVSYGIEGLRAAGESSTQFCGQSDVTLGECELYSRLSRRQSGLLLDHAVAYFFGTVALGLGALVSLVLRMVGRKR